MTRLARVSFRVLVGLSIFCAVWAGIVAVFDIPPYMLPGPFSVMASFQERGEFLIYHASITAYETLLGFVAGVAAGMAVACTMWLFPIARKALLPTILITQALPVFAIAPILVLWLGFGLASKVVMAVLIIFFAVASTLYDGLNLMEPGMADLARLYRLNRIDEFRYLRFPAALPALASGIRIAAVFAPIGAIVGEWVGAKGGLAFIMLQSNARMQTDMMFAALILLALMVLALRFAADYLVQFLVPWQREDALPTHRRNS